MIEWLDRSQNSEVKDSGIMGKKLFCLIRQKCNFLGYTTSAISVKKKKKKKVLLIMLLNSNDRDSGHNCEMNEYS